DKQRRVDRCVGFGGRKESADLRLRHGPDAPHPVSDAELVRATAPPPAEAEGRIGQDDPVVHRVRQDHRERGPDDPHGVLAQPRSSLLCEEDLDHAAGDIAQAHAAESREDMEPQLLGVALQRPGANLTGDDCQPRVLVLSERDLSVRREQSGMLTVANSLREEILRAFLGWRSEAVAPAGSVTIVHEPDIRSSSSASPYTGHAYGF